MRLDAPDHSDPSPDWTHLKYRREGKVAIISYDCQRRRNAWGLAMYREVVRAVEQANADEQIGAIVISHEGPVFCAGTDIKDGPHPPDPDTGRRPTMASEAMAPDSGWLQLMARSKPVIGAVKGRAIGLGVTQLLPMDIRVGAESSSYSFPFLEKGFMPELGCTSLLSRLVGFGVALDLCLTAATISASEAFRIGLITHLVPDDRLLETALAIATRIAGFGRFEVSATKRLFLENEAQTDLDAVLQREIDAFIDLRRHRRAR